MEGHGDLETVRRASWKAKEFVQWASERRREPVDLSDLTVSIKCGESDTTTGLASCPTVGVAVDRLIDEDATVFFGETSELTGGEHLIAERMATPELRERFQAIYDDYVELIEEQSENLLGSQPTQGNIAGGLSTIEEKALGNIQKIGRKCLVDGVLDKAEAPTGPGPPRRGGEGASVAAGRADGDAFSPRRASIVSGPRSVVVATSMLLQPRSRIWFCQVYE